MIRLGEPRAPEYLLHGLRIRCPFLLSADTVSADVASVNVDASQHHTYPLITVRVREVSKPIWEADGTAQLVLHWLEPDDLLEDVVTLHRVPQATENSLQLPGTWLFSYAGVRFWFDEALSEVVIECQPGTDIAWAQVLFEGWALSVLITLRGGLVLHASSVLINERLVVMVGRSGQGKSTLAALLCATDAQLFSDDVLHVVAHNSDSLVETFRGANSLRMRPDAAAHPGLAGLGQFVQADDRWLCQPHRSVPEKARVAAVIVPCVVGADQPWDLNTLSAPRAVIELLKYPRTFHWLLPEHQAQAFDGATAIASRVPVSVLSIPNGQLKAERVRNVVDDLLHGLRP